MVAMSESATRVIAVEERTLKFDLRTNGGCDRASIRENVANHPSKRPVREASRKPLSTGRRGQGSRLVRLESAPSILPGSTTWKRARRCVWMMMSLPAVCKALLCIRHTDRVVAMHLTGNLAQGPSQGRTGRSNFQEARLAMVSARHGWRRGGDYRLSLRVMTRRLRESLTAHGTPRSAASPAVLGKRRCCKRRPCASATRRPGRVVLRRDELLSAALRVSRVRSYVASSPRRPRAGFRGSPPTHR